MEVTAKTLREVEFREKLRGGYHPEDVDEFLEEVALGVEALHERLRQAQERALRAEKSASESPASDDDALRRTLVLAQRTADMAVQEAREQAAQILAEAEKQAQTLFSESERRAREEYDHALERSRAELTKLEEARGEAESAVRELNRWVDESRSALLASLRQATTAIESGNFAPAPFVPARSVSPEIRSGGRDQGAAEISDRPSGTDSLSDSGSENRPEIAEHRADETEDRLNNPAQGQLIAEGMAESQSQTSSGSEPQRSFVQQPPLVAQGEQRQPEPTVATDTRAMDDFFEDADFGDDQRFGRLRRRR